MSPTMTGATLLLLLSCAILQPLKGFIVILHPVEKWQHTHCALPKENSNDEISPSSNASKPDQPSSELSLEWVEYYGPQNSRHSTPVLFLHGLLGSKRNFESLGKMLGTQLEEKRRILGVDLRNHGDTLPHSRGMSYPSMAQDVINFLDSQNISKVILVGHSMGGKVAQCLALQHPEYVDGLIVLDVAPVAYHRLEDPNWRAVEDILHAMNDIKSDTKREIDLSLRQKIPDPALRAFVLTNFDNRSKQWKIPISIIVEELEQIAGFDLLLKSSLSYDGDVFIINGGQSRFVRHSHMDQIALLFPNHMLTTIRSAGHWVHAEAPERCVALLKKYLDR